MYELITTSTVGPLDASVRQLKRARIAVAITFATNGLVLGAWAPRIPEVKAHLGLSSASLGLALLAPAIGALFAMRIVGGLCAKHGSAVVTRWLVGFYGVIAWLPGVAPNLPSLWLTLFLLGTSIGGIDVAMNSQGVTVELGYRRPVLSSFHAAWSVGSFGGAVIGGIGAGLHASIGVQQAVLGVGLAIFTLWKSRAFLTDSPHETEVVVARTRRLPDPRLILLGFSALFALMAEGAVADWSGVLLRDHLHVHAGQVGLAFAAFSVTMTFGRIVGDRVVHALGPARCITVLSAIGAVGLAAGMATNSLAGYVIGFAILGVGLSIMVPVLFSAAADGGPSGPAIAVVSTIGYTGFLAGPSGIGVVAQAISVQFALWMLPFFAVLGGVLGVTAVRMSSTPADQESVATTD